MNVEAEDSEESDSSVELLRREILDSEEEGGIDPIAKALEIVLSSSRQPTQRKIDEQEGEEEDSDDEIEILDQITSSPPRGKSESEDIITAEHAKVKQTLIPQNTIMVNITQDLKVNSAVQQEVAPMVISKVTKPSQIRQPSKPKRVSLSQLCSKNSTPRTRTGLSKRVKISSLHPNLNRK